MSPQGAPQAPMRSNPSDHLKQLVRQQQPYDWNAMNHFLCHHHGVNDPSLIEPFGKLYPAYELMRDVTLRVDAVPPQQSVTFTVDGSVDAESQCVSCPIQFDPNKALPNNPFCNPHTGAPMPVNMDRVHIYNIISRHVRSTVPGIHVAVRLNFVHAGWPKAVRDRDAMNVAAGGIRGEYYTIKPTAEAARGIDLRNAVAMPQLDFSSVNAQFIATMALINEHNIMNGVIDIPRDACLAMRLPVFRHDWTPPVLDEARELRDVPEDRRAEATLVMRKQFAARVAAMQAARDQAVQESACIESFKALPADHVLAWGLRSTALTERFGYRALTFEFVPAKDNPRGLPLVQHMLYFLVDNITFARLLADVQRFWVPMLDTRPLRSVAFEFVPKVFSGPADRARIYPDMPVEAKQASGSVALRSYLHYYVEPVLSVEQQRALAPRLHPQMRHANDFA